jgi:hypothetical protein
MLCSFSLSVQRVKTELESGRKWDENWGTLFNGEVPHNYTDRIKYLEKELKGFEYLICFLLYSHSFC